MELINKIITKVIIFFCVKIFPKAMLIYFSKKFVRYTQCKIKVYNFNLGIAFLLEPYIWVL